MLLGAILGRALVSTAQTFSIIDTSGAGVDDDGKYFGAAALGTYIYFTPAVQDNVGVLNTANNNFTTIQTDAGCVDVTSGLPCIDGDHKYAGAAIVGSKVYFAPRNEDSVGVVDTTTNTFSTIDTSAAGVIADWKYRDIVALGTKVYMSPYKEEHVGVVDTTTDTFSTIANTSLAGVTGTNLYWGAAAVGTKIYFAPWQASSVGVLETANNTFSTIDISAAGLTGGTNQYTSAVAVGKDVFFAPYSENNVGVVDTATDTFSTINITAGVTSNTKYQSAAAVGTRVFFAPRTENNVGVVDTTTYTFSTIDISNFAIDDEKCKPLLAPVDPRTLRFLTCTLRSRQTREPCAVFTFKMKVQNCKKSSFSHFAS